MKVIARDNFDREYIGDILIKENVTYTEGQKLCDELNAKTGEHGDRYHETVSDNYKLFIPKTP